MKVYKAGPATFTFIDGEVHELHTDKYAVIVESTLVGGFAPSELRAIADCMEQVDTPSKGVEIIHVEGHD